MEPRLGDGELGLIPGGDVCIEDDRIAAVGQGLDGSGARIVDATGKIDTRVCRRAQPPVASADSGVWDVSGCG